jgi:hypothetical protein
MSLRRFVVPITVDSSGDAIVYSPVLNGHLHSIRYLKDDFADGIDFVVTLETSGETVWSEENVNASATRYPRAATHSTAGVAALFAAGEPGVLDRIAISQERIKLVVANGGTETSGEVHITIDG